MTQEHFPVFPIEETEQGIVSQETTNRYWNSDTKRPESSR